MDLWSCVKDMNIFVVVVVVVVVIVVVVVRMVTE